MKCQLIKNLVIHQFNLVTAIVWQQTQLPSSIVSVDKCIALVNCLCGSMHCIGLLVCSHLSYNLGTCMHSPLVAPGVQVRLGDRL